MANTTRSLNASNTMSSSGVVYVGIPLTQAGAAGNSSPSSLPKPSNFKMSGGYGFLAFVVGAILGLIGWIANQGWTIVSVLLFGQFDWTLASAWKHVLICLVGAISTAVAFWAVFQKMFRDVVEEDRDDDDVKESLSSMNNFKKDISNAVQDLGEVGFIAGYFGSQVFLTTLVYKPFTGIGIEYDHSNHCLNGGMLVFMMLWILCTKLRDYKRAVKRAAINDVQRVVDSSSAYVQMV